MRSPQAAIITLLEGGEGTGVPAAISARVVGHARRTLSLADNFVQLARLRGTRYAPEEVDLADVMIEAADALWPIAARRGVRISTDGADQPCLVLGEHSALVRALINLIDNAVRFSPDQGIVHCRIDRTDDAARCVIEDDGPGVPIDRAGALFDRFGPTAGKRGALSSGLGLAYVRSVAERHGGDLRYEPRSPHGTRFVVTLPIGSRSAGERGPGQSWE
jgi:signal transduction histidine kinase